MKLKTQRKSLADVLPNPQNGWVNALKLGNMYWGKIQKCTDLTTKKAEVTHATPQDLSTVLRWA